MVETLEGRIRKVRYHSVGARSRSGVPFLIAQLQNGSTVKGEMVDPSYEENYRFVGTWRPQKGPYGDAFEFDHYEEIVEESVPGVAQYLARKIKGIGRRKAEDLAEAFGADTIRTLQLHPERALEVKGITTAHVDALREYFDENKRLDIVAVTKVIDLFGGNRFPRKIAESVVMDFGSDAPAIIKANPYILLAYPRVGWLTVDPFAIDTGYDAGGIERHRAAILEAFSQHSNEGHTIATRAEIDSIAYTLINAVPATHAWAAALMAGDIVSRFYFYEPDILQALNSSIDPSEFQAQAEAALNDPTNCFALPSLDSAESSIAHQLARLEQSANPIPFAVPTDGLNDDQAAAVRGMEQHGVFLLLGAPGTGKSYTVAHFIRQLVDGGFKSIRAVAPTGKAAKRMDELLARAFGKSGVIESSTIHRALEPTPSTAPLGVPADSAKIHRGRDAFGFARNEGNPLDVNMLIVDEASMADVKLFDSLVRALKPGTRLVIVGDTNQLPSVGPGSVLRDLRDAGVPAVELSKIVRSDGGGRIVKACHAIKDGIVPQPAKDINLPTENWVHVERGTPGEILETIVGLYKSIRDNGNYDPYWGVQVVAAQKEKDGIGCADLNVALSFLLNNQPDQAEDDGTGRRDEFKTNDKVVRTKNGLVDEMTEIPPGDNARIDWRWNMTSWSISETSVVNGDMGTVEAIVTEPKAVWVIVRFRNPDRLCRLPFADCNLAAAFALTVHKAQGSGFPVVIVPVSLAYHWNPKNGTGLFSRELFYTAISRAEQVLITVGQWAAVEAVVRRQTIGYRRTTLRDRVVSAMSRESCEGENGEEVTL